MPEATSDRALKGWHPGEAAVQDIIHLPARVPITAIVNRLPEQHRLFHTTRLHFLPITTLDDQGRPWASVLTPTNGDVPFISSSDDTHLQIKARVWNGDPAVRNLMDCESTGERVLISALGIEVSTRRRNKFAGYVENAEVKRESMSLNIAINEALGYAISSPGSPLFADQYLMRLKVMSKVHQRSSGVPASRYTPQGSISKSGADTRGTTATICDRLHPESRHILSCDFLCGPTRNPR